MKVITAIKKFDSEQLAKLFLEFDRNFGCYGWGNIPDLELQAICTSHQCWQCVQHWLDSQMKEYEFTGMDCEKRGRL